MGIDFQFLTEVWDEDADFLEEALARCCQRRSLTVEKTHITDNESLSPDVEGDRDRHRRDRGYVTALSASAFLARLKSSSLHDLALEFAYDPYTNMQLSRRQADSGTHAASPGADPEFAAGPDARQFERELEGLLEPIFAETAQARTLLLNGPQRAGQTYLDQQLRTLAASEDESDSATLAMRYREIVYLANVLMEGIALGGKRLTENEATKCVHHTCNLGLMYCVFEAPWADETWLVSELLEQAPGLVKCFGIGYNLIQQLQGKLHEALQRVLLADSTHRRLRKEPWLQTLIREEFETTPESTPFTGSRVRNINSLLDSLLFFCDASAIEQLRLLADDLPRFPCALDEQEESGIHVNKAWRFFSTPADLHAVQCFINELDTRLW